MFTASLPPAVVASTLKALERMQQDPGLRQKLSANAQRLFDGLNALGFQTGAQASPIVAVTMSDTATALEFWNRLLAQGVYLNLALPPATPDSRPLLRSSVSAAHSFEQIDAVLDAFATVGRQMNVLAPAAQSVSR